MKNHLAKILSLFVESVPNALLKRYFNGLVPIFMLHRLSSNDKKHTQEYHAHIRWCLSYIKKHGYKTISLSELGLKHKNCEPIEPKTLVFTIDDGFYDQFEYGSPLFGEFDIPLTCFVITDFLVLPENQTLSFSNTSENCMHNINQLRNKLKTLDQTNLYDWLKYFYNEAEVETPTKPPKDYQPMSWLNAQKFIDSGHKIAPHTKTHRILSQLDDKTSETEIIDSYNRVKKMLNNSCNVFAYPTGRVVDYSKREKLILERNQIPCAVNTQAFHFKPTINPFDMPRFSLPESRFDFIQYLSFFEELKCRIKN